MPGTSKKISELDSASSLGNSDLLEVAVVNALSDTGYSSKKTTIEDIADKVVAINPQEQADWIEADNTEPSYIKNKPTLATVATSGDYDDLTNKPTIPSAQVNSDWDAVSGVAQILNKPTLATVATSGDYDDLTNKPTIPSAPVQSNWNESDTSSLAYIQNKPTIPSAQVNSDWNSVSGVSQILNKPTLATVATSGDYTDLSNTPTIPDGLADLTDDVNISSPTDGQILKYDGTSSKWVNGTGGGGGASALNDLTDVTITSATLTSGQVLKYNGSAWVNDSGGGSSWTDLTDTLLAGQTSLTIQDVAITANSTIDVYTDTFGVSPTNQVVTSGQIVLTFEAQANDVGVKVRVS